MELIIYNTKNGRNAGGFSVNFAAHFRGKSNFTIKYTVVFFTKKRHFMVKESLFSTILLHFTKSHFSRNQRFHFNQSLKRVVLPMSFTPLDGFTG